MQCLCPWVVFFLLGEVVGNHMCRVQKRRRKLPMLGFANSTVYMVGAPQKTVTLCRWIAVNAAVVSNRGSRTIFAPRQMGTFMLVVMP